MGTLKKILFILVKFLLTLALFIPVAATIIAFSVFAFTADVPELSESQVEAIVLLSVLFVSAIILFFPIGLFIDPEKEKGLRESRGFIIVVMIGFVCYLLVDAPSFEEKYSLEDLQPRERESDNTLFLVNSIIKADAIAPFPDIQPLRDREHHKNVLDYRQSIVDAWKAIKPYRLLMDQLADYDYLYMPVETGDTAGSYIRLRDIGIVYSSYTLLLAELGDNEGMLECLRKIQKIARNGMRESVSVIQKMVWNAVLRNNIGTAYHIAINQNLSDKDLEELAQIFTPLTDEEIGFHKPWLGEYFFVTRSFNYPWDQMFESRFHYETRPWFLEKPPSWLKVLFRTLNYRPNRSKIMAAEHWYDLIEKAGKNEHEFYKTTPPLKAALTDVPVRNLLGWYIYVPSGFLAFQDKCRIEKVRSDIFAIYLNQRLQNKRTVYDYFSNKPDQMMKKNDTLLSAGSDTVFNTEDDIALAPLN